jgi:MFS family permease
VHFTVVVAVTLAVGAAVLPWVPPRASLGDPAPAGIAAPVARPALRERLAGWADPRLLLIGVVMLGMSFSEGGANDWIAVATVDGHGGTEAQGALALTVFVSFMTAGRLTGGRVVDRFGRVIVIRVSAVIAALGIALFILAPDPWAVLAGAGLWGLGSCLGFPLGMSVAADAPGTAARRVAAVAVIGYLAFLAGPPVLGLVSETIGILAALWILFGLVVLSLLAAPATREPDGRRGLLRSASAAGRVT